MKSTEWRSVVDDSAGPDACWPAWQRFVNHDGYAIAWCSDLRRGVSLARLALADKLGRPIAPGMFACHTCDNRRCANPAHLYEGDAASNGADMASRGRARNGHTRSTLPRLDLGGGYHYLNGGTR